MPAELHALENPSSTKSPVISVGGASERGSSLRNCGAVANQRSKISKTCVIQNSDTIRGGNRAPSILPSIYSCTTTFCRLLLSSSHFTPQKHQSHNTRYHTSWHPQQPPTTHLTAASPVTFTEIISTTGTPRPRMPFTQPAMACQCLTRTSHSDVARTVLFCCRTST